MSGGPAYHRRSIKRRFVPFRPRSASWKGSRKGRVSHKRLRTASMKSRGYGRANTPRGQLTRAGIPRSSIPITGSNKISISARNHARRIGQLFEARCEGSVPIASDTSPVAGVCNTLAFIPSNNFSGVSFASGSGANVVGLPTTVQVNRVAYGTPDGMFTMLYDRFATSYVKASSVTVKIQRTGTSSTASDGVIMFALTPMSPTEAAASFTNTPVSTYYLPSWASSSNNNWLGANGAQQWQNCINTPGTRVKTLYFAAAGPGEVKLSLTKSEDWFNTEPMWDTNTNFYNTAAAPGAMPVAFQNYYVLTYYISAGFAASTGQQISLGIHQKWWVKGFFPNSSLVVGETKRNRDRLSAAVLRSVSDSKEPMLTAGDDEDEVLVAGMGRTSVATPRLPAVPATPPPVRLGPLPPTGLVLKRTAGAAAR